MHHLLLHFLRFMSISPSSDQDSCETCIDSGKRWCIETSKCGVDMFSCVGLIKYSLNCPRLPSTPYNDTFMRNEQLVLAAATQAPDIQKCFDIQLPSMKLYRRLEVNCSSRYPEATCVGYTAYSLSSKSIAISFKGARGNHLKYIHQESARLGLHPYFNGHGRIFKIVYDSFLLLWKGGLGDDLLQLKRRHPDFELWVNGHSFGALLAFTMSSFLVTTGLYKPTEIKVVGMGMERMGDYRWAEWHSRTFPFAYHLVHHRDPITRYPPRDLHSGTRLWHPRTEVWYDNHMKPGEPFEICKHTDGHFCSDMRRTELVMDDHDYYFNVHIPLWGRAGCPLDRTKFEQSEQ